MTDTMNETLAEKWVRQYERDPGFVAEGLATDTIEQVITKLEESGVTQSSLAETMNVSRQQISRMFNAPPNLTLLSIARLAVAFGTKPRIIFDSGAFFIRPLTEPLEWEEFASDKEKFLRERSITNDASTATLLGGSRYGTAG